MSLPADYHMHTPLCLHAKGEPVELAAYATQIGLPEIGFSDHNPMPRDGFDDWRMRADELQVYVEKVNLARRHFPGLEIKLALEVDYIPGYEGWIRELARLYPWDYFIGSVHYISADWAIDNPNLVANWQTRDTLEVWTTYFDRLTQAAESGLFDIIGHADLCKRFGFFPKADCSHLFTRFLSAARNHGVAIELNTAGLRKDCKEIYPSPAFLTLARQIGVPITFGSDAHAANDVGRDFGEAVKLARSVGYTHCCRFTRRQRKEVCI